MKKRGQFWVIDGPEGAGKGTLIERAKEYLRGFPVVFTHEPGGTPFAEEIRNLILHSKNAGQADARTLFALFWAARADNVANVIAPALKKGYWVISDRFDSSTFAYQIVAQGARELEKFFWQTRSFYLRNAKPDKYVFLKVDPKVGLMRKQKQGDGHRNHFEARKLEFHKKLYGGFGEFLGHFPKEKVLTVNANLSADKVWLKFKKILDRLLLRNI